MVRIKSKVEPSREWSSVPRLHLSVVAIEKGAFGSPSTKVTNFTNDRYIKKLRLLIMIIKKRVEKSDQEHVLIHFIKHVQIF